MPAPEAGQHGTDRRAGAIAIQPAVHFRGRGEERRVPGIGEAGEVLLGTVNVAFFVELRHHHPLTQRERVAGGGKDGAAVDDA